MNNNNNNNIKLEKKTRFKKIQNNYVQCLINSY